MYYNAFELLEFLCSREDIFKSVYIVVHVLNNFKIQLHIIDINLLQRYFTII